MLDIAILPDQLAADADVAITFDTAVNPSESGVSGRKERRLDAIRTYSVGINPDYVAEVQAIFLANLGRRYPLAIKDWANNYSATDEVLEKTITTDQTTAPLRRLYLPKTGPRGYYQRVLVPDERVTPVTIKINGVTVTTGTEWTITDPGIITIYHALDPDDVLTWSGQYLVPVCPIQDALGIRVHHSSLSGIEDVQFQEILEAELSQLLGL